MPIVAVPIVFDVAKFIEDRRFHLSWERTFDSETYRTNDKQELAADAVRLLQWNFRDNKELVIIWRTPRAHQRDRLS